MKRRALPLVSATLAAGLIVGAAVLQERWIEHLDAGTASRLQALAELLAHRGMPDAFAEWEGDESEEMAPAAHADSSLGYACYIYRHMWTKRRVHVYVVCGPARTIARHTPADIALHNSVNSDAVCGFHMEIAPRRWTVMLDSVRADLASSIFAKEEGTAAHRLRVAWTCRDGDQWVPDLSLTKLRGSRPVTKVYFVSDAPTIEADEADPTIEFARVFLPALGRSLFSDPASK